MEVTAAGAVRTVTKVKREIVLVSIKGENTLSCFKPAQLVPLGSFPK